MKKKHQEGFTLAELLIVVAIIAVLVAIAIPIFNGQLEKSRRAVDMHNARNIESALMVAFTDGTIQVPKQDHQDGYGAWVTICRTPDSAPDAYRMNGKTVFCGANKGVIVNGTVSAEWNVYDNNVEKILTEAGIKVDSLKVHSKDSVADGGWDWVIIEVGYKSGSFYSRIYSGQKKVTSGANKFGLSNIEKQIG